MINEGEPTGEIPVQPEEEIKELSLEQQAQIYADIWKKKKVTAEAILQRAQELQAEMSEEDRRDLRMMIYLPKGIRDKNLGITQDHNQAFTGARGMTDIT